MALLKIGDLAPDFNLLDQDGELISFSDFKEQRLLIYFYPKAMTPGCTIQACCLRDNINCFKKHKVEILGISTDKPKKLSLFSDKELLNFSLLSDENHVIANKFGVWGTKSFMGRTYEGIYRTSFLISANKIIEQVFNHIDVYNHHIVIMNYLNNL